MAAAPGPVAVMHGTRILDFTWYGVGPISTKYLADNGAEVVKVESATRPDGLRIGPPWQDATPGLNRSQFFGSFNSSKKSIALDLSREEARDLVRRLVPHFDVVAESFTPPTMDEWGLGYADLRAVRRDLIMLSTCMQGQTGPNAGYPGFGNLMASLSGFYGVAGYSESEPAPPYGAYTDFIAPRFGACALMAAIEVRRRTGRGQHIDLSQFEAAVHFLAPAILDYFATGRVTKPAANRSHRYAPHGAYRCVDDGEDERWVAISVGDDGQWDALLGVVGSEGADVERFAGIVERMWAAEEVDAFVQSRVSGWTAPDLVSALQAAGVPAYPVNNCLDLHTDENLAGFDFFHWLDQEEAGPMPYEGFGYRLSATPGSQTAAPNLGRHTEEILGDLLGLSASEIRRLEEDGIAR